MTNPTFPEPAIPGEPLVAPSSDVPPAAARPSNVAPSNGEPVGANVDAALAARLERLAASRAGARHDPIAPSTRTTAPKKRRHPAQHSRTAALALSVLASGGLGMLFAATDHPVSASAQPAGIVTAGTAATPVAATTAATAPVTTATTAAAATAAPATTTPAATVPVAADVTINGSVFTNKWGDVQVQATFASDGTIFNVSTLQTPSRDDKSVSINNRAVPQLNSEALTAQSAKLDTVSGATYTSDDYKKSLQSAIDTAVASGLPVAAAAA